MSGPAYELGHGAHRTVYAPGSGLKEHHGKKSQYGGSKHDAVKAKGKLRNAIGKQGAVISPVPGQLKRPEQCDYPGSGF